MTADLRLDIIGDIHGQLDVLRKLGRELAYDVDNGWSHPEGRRLVFIGDLVDRGPKSLEVAELVRELCASGQALCLMGNHEFNLVEWRHGRVGPKPSNEDTIADIEARRNRWEPVLDFFESLPLALELSDLRVAHALWICGCMSDLDAALSKPSPSHEPSSEWASLIRLHTPYDGGQWRSDIPRRHFRDEQFGQQDKNALGVLLKGPEIPAEETFKDKEGDPKGEIRVLWWEHGHPEISNDQRVVFGHYWNLPPMRGRHEAFVPPHPSGHPTLRAWAAEHGAAIPHRGRGDVPENVQAVCIDYNGATYGGGERACLGAYRYPDAEVVWST